MHTGTKTQLAGTASTLVQSGTCFSGAFWRGAPSTKCFLKVSDNPKPQGAAAAASVVCCVRFADKAVAIPLVCWTAIIYSVLRTQQDGLVVISVPADPFCGPPFHQPHSKIRTRQAMSSYVRLEVGGREGTKDQVKVHYNPLNPR